MCVACLECNVANVNSFTLLMEIFHISDTRQHSSKKKFKD